jgi:hypothetical protein
MGKKMDQNIYLAENKFRVERQGLSDTQAKCPKRDNEKSQCKYPLVRKSPVRTNMRQWPE